MAIRRRLPRPCPKCGKEYGTIQIVYFPKSRHKGKKRGYKNNDSWIVRIGHYDSLSYKKAKKAYEDSIELDKTQLRKDLSTSQRKWCSFLSNVPNVLHDWEWQGDASFYEKPDKKFLDYVSNNGWRIYQPQRIAQRKEQVARRKKKLGW